MTVKCINYIDKQAIIGLFRAKHFNQRELAQLYKTSERTIHRVLVEAGIATTVPRIKGEAYMAMQILKEQDVTVEELRNVLIAGKDTIRQMEESITNQESQQLSYLNEDLEDVPF